MSTSGRMMDVPEAKTVRDTYHHGDLANALTTAATELARRGGPEAVVLREAARQIGVSAAAAYRYFQSRAELIHAVKEFALAELAERMQAELVATEPLADPVRESLRRMRGLGAGYIAFALAEPGLFRTAFRRTEGKEQDDAVMALLDTRSFQMLTETLDELVEAGWVAPERRPLLELAAWSTV